MDKNKFFSFPLSKVFFVILITYIIYLVQINQNHYYEAAISFDINQKFLEKNAENFSINDEILQFYQPNFLTQVIEKTEALSLNPSQRNTEMIQYQQQLRQSVSIDIDAQSQHVKLRVYDKDSNKAALLALAFIDTYKENIFNLGADGGKKGQHDLDKRLIDLKEKIQNKESYIDKFTQNNSFIIVTQNEKKLLTLILDEHRLEIESEFFLTQNKIDNIAETIYTKFPNKPNLEKLTDDIFDQNIFYKKMNRNLIQFLFQSFLYSSKYSRDESIKNSSDIDQNIRQWKNRLSELLKPADKQELTLQDEEYLSLITYYLFLEREAFLYQQLYSRAYNDIASMTEAQKKYHDLITETDHLIDEYEKLNTQKLTQNSLAKDTDQELITVFPVQHAPVTVGVLKNIVMVLLSLITSFGLVFLGSIFREWKNKKSNNKTLATAPKK